MPENIQSKEVAEKVKEWGDKPCNHEGQLLKEYTYGMATGDYICASCGEARWGSGWNQK